MKDKTSKGAKASRKAEETDAAGKKRTRSEDSGVARDKKKVAVEKEDNFFSWLLGVSEASFFETYFEKKHLHVSHQEPSFFTKGFPAGGIPPVEWSTELMEKIVGSKTMHYGTDLNVVRFDEKLKQRVSYKTEGVCSLPELKKCMSSGWSVRFLRPHEHTPCNSSFIAMMEKYFVCYCGLNSYWTPANSQGFAPHYDDVDVFLLQLEGEKEWRIYDPLEDVDYLSRHSSEDYVPEQFPKPKQTLTLKAGDVLYMPRGLVHQGRTLPHTHSLHITFSANQMNSWADFFLVASRYSVETLSANQLSWRSTIPRSAFSLLGAANDPDLRAVIKKDLSKEQLAERAELQSKIRQFVAELGLLMTDETNIDFCADEYAKQSIEKMQPVQSTTSSFAPGSTTPKSTLTTFEVTPSTRVRLVASHGCRLVLNVTGEAILYHNGENGVVCFSGELGMLRFEREFAPALATLLAVSSAVKVSSIPFPDFEDPTDVSENQQLLCETLRDAGLLEEAKA